MRKYRILFLAMLIAFVISAPVHAAEHIKITVFTDATWPPMQMVDKKNKIVGFDIDIMDEIAKEGGFTVEYRNTSWDDIFTALRSTKYPSSCAISSITITESRKKSYDFSETYLTVNQDLVVPQNLDIEDMNGLKGKRVGIQTSSSGAAELKKHKEIIMKQYDDIRIAFEDMAAGNLEGILCDSPVARYYAFHRNEFKDKFKVGYVITTNEQLGIMVKKGDAKTLELINKGLDAVKSKGTDKKITEKWM